MSDHRVRRKRKEKKRNTFKRVTTLDSYQSQSALHVDARVKISKAIFEIRRNFPKGSCSLAEKLAQHFEVPRCQGARDEISRGISTRNVSSLCRVFRRVVWARVGGWVGEGGGERKRNAHSSNLSGRTQSTFHGNARE